MRTGAGQVAKIMKSTQKVLIHTVSKFIDLVPFHLICQMLAKFSGVESDRIVSKFRKRKCREVQPLKEIWLL